MDAALREIGRALVAPGTLRVGFLENSTYPDGKPTAMIAAIQEFGAPSVGIPPRPYFRNMVAAKSPGWPATLANLLRTNNYDAQAALELMGEGIKGQLQQSIQDTNEPPLRPATIRRKGHSKPLIDSGHMINSVDYDIKPGAIT